MNVGSMMKQKAPILEAGTYLAVCVGAVFAGEMYIPPFGEQKQGRYENQLLLIWDVPSEVSEAGTPKQLSKRINVTAHPNGALTAILSSWLNKKLTKEELKALDTDELLGKPCQLSVAVSESGFCNVTAVTALAKGIPAPVSSTPYISFSVDAWDDSAFSKLPAWVQEIIKKSTEYGERAPVEALDFETADESAGACPF